MNRYGSLITVSLLATLSLACPADSSAAVLQFLQLGVGARAAAMGDAVVSHVDDASAVFWNPGAIAFLQQTQIELAHNETFQGVRDEFGAVTRNFGRHSLGFSFNGLWTDPLKGYDDSGVRQSDFNYYDMQLSGNYSYMLTSSLGVGFGVEYLSEVIDISSFSGLGFNLGVQARDVLPRTSVGLSVLHLGSDIQFEKESFPLPREIQGGITHILPIGALGGRLLVAAELRKAREESAQLLLGTEYEYRNAARLEFGYHGGLDTRDVAFGLGVGGGRIRGEYSVIPYSSNLGTSQRIALLFQF